ncbi:MAG: DUF411 domain-containing protein [Gemmatimonadota bacterium]|nr:DUF411 domain-containing protein [Gemmatimonadota bacterium]
MLTRREWFRMSVGGAAAVALTGAASGFATALRVAPELVVYKSPTCGCCQAWVNHARASGFRVTTRDLEDLTEVKATFGVPAALQSCHTTTVAGYVIEGHVPADLIRGMLAERPKFAGIAVPGMPVGSPGMEMGARKDGYEVIAFEKNGKTRVYARR